MVAMDTSVEGSGAARWYGMPDHHTAQQQQQHEENHMAASSSYFSAYHGYPAMNHGQSLFFQLFSDISLSIFRPVIRASNVRVSVLFTIELYVELSLWSHHHHLHSSRLKNILPPCGKS